MRAQSDKSIASAPWPWYRYVFYALRRPYLLVIFVIVLPIFVILGVLGSFAVLINWLSERSFRSQMRRRNRFLSWDEALRRIGQSGGTLIIETPSPGWNFTHAWWTPEDVLAKSPYSMPSEEEYIRAAEESRCLDWDRWCWDNYICPEKGTAFLLRVWNGESLERRLKQWFPHLPVVRTWTALMRFPVLASDTSARR